MAMNIEEVKVEGYERVVYAQEPSAGLRAFIAIHNTNRGPSCGGIRLLPYSSKEEALTDVLRLSKGMSYKSALAQIGFGGGKSVIIADPKQKSQALFHAFGEFVDSLKGRYIAAKDMNIDSDDLRVVKQKTKHVLGIDGEPGSSGDPSPVTARGVYRALEACAETVWGTKSLQGLTLAIQGIGHVGYAMAEMAKKAGAKIVVADINQATLEKARKELGATVVGLEEIYDVECDIFSPSARGAVLNEKTIPRLKCKAIVGCANNQLATEHDGFRLHERGILYGPDYLVNAGGIINIFVELDGYQESRAFQMADKIYDTTKEIFRRAKETRTPPFVVADEMALERMQK